MDFSHQQLRLPYLLAAELFPKGVTTVPLPTEYDFLLTDITGLTGGGDQVSAQISLPSGAAPIGLEFPSTSGGVIQSPATWHGFLPLGGVASLTVTMGGDAAHLAFSGWLLTPTNAQILPS